MKQKITVSDIIRRGGFAVCAVFCLFAFFACSNSSSSSSRTLSDIFAPNVSVVYDGRPHSISIANTLPSDTVTYSTDGVSFSSIVPVFTEVGIYTVYFKVFRSGYSEVASSATVSISPSVISGIYADNISVVYDGLPHSIVVCGTQDSDLLLYSTDGVSFSSIAPEFTDIGEYTVYYCVSRPYGEYRSSCTVSILPYIYGRYFNPSFGVISLSRYSASVNSSSFALSFSVSGSGYIDSDPFSVSNGILYFHDLSFCLLSDSDFVYRLNNSVYFLSSASGTLSVSFKNNIAEITLSEDILLSVPNVNYCDTGVIADYSLLRFEQSFLSSSSDITDIYVALSFRDINPISVDCMYFTYDGLPHGFDFSIPVIFPDYDSPPSFSLVGTYTVSVIFVSDTYLPKILPCSIVILPDLSGVYLSLNHVIHISSGVISFDGISLGELSILNDAWAYNGLPISVTDDGIVYDGAEYDLTAELVIVICLDDAVAAVVAIPDDAVDISITILDASLVFDCSGSVLLSVPIPDSDFTLLLNNLVLSPDTSPPHFVLGRSDLSAPVVVLRVVG